MTIHEFVSIFKDFAVGVSAISAAIFAWKGVRTWRHELHGKAAHETGRSLLRAVYKVREAARSVRNPLMMPNEVREALQDADHADIGPESNLHPLGSAATFAKRWNRVSEALIELQLARLEAEVLWGDRIRNLTDDFRSSIHELWVAVHMFGMSEVNRMKTGESLAAVLSGKLHELLYLTDSKNDAFEQKIAAEIEKIERHVREIMDM